MTSSTFANHSPADQYVVAAIAVRDHTPVSDLAALPPQELDRRLPGARATYEHRQQVADSVRERLGLNPESAEYQDAAKAARSVLEQVDQLESDHAA